MEGVHVVTIVALCVGRLGAGCVFAVWELACCQTDPKPERAVMAGSITTDTRTTSSFGTRAGSEPNVETLACATIRFNPGLKNTPCLHTSCGTWTRKCGSLCLILVGDCASMRCVPGQRRLLR